jgi:ribonuclease D
MAESSGRDDHVRGCRRIRGRALTAGNWLSARTWRWRDQPPGTNRPAFKVLGNQEILEWVHWAESHPGKTLNQGPKLPRNIVGAQLTTFHEAITRVRGTDEAEWPEPKKHDRAVPRNDSIEEINELRGECARIARELEIAASILAPKAALEAIARSRPRSVDEIMASGGLLRWQAKLVHRAVEKCLHSTQKVSAAPR